MQVCWRRRATRIVEVYELFRLTFILYWGGGASHFSNMPATFLPYISRMTAACQPHPGRRTPASCQPHASLMTAICQLRDSHMPATCQPHTSQMPAS
jgi:hypothetical protein